jgi:hypothetical protein
MWNSEIGSVVAADFDQTKLAACKERARAIYAHAGDLDKNPLFIAEWLSIAWEQHLKSGTLVRLCDAILAHCKVLSSEVPATVRATSALATATT